MAKGLVYLFGRAFLFQITALALSPFALVSAVVVGVAVTAVAALYPALRAGRVSPVEAMRSRAVVSPGRRSRVWSVLTPLFGLTLLGVDRKSTRLNSSYANISYAVFCLKKKKTS